MKIRYGVEPTVKNSEFPVSAQNFWDKVCSDLSFFLQALSTRVTNLLKMLWESPPRIPRVFYYDHNQEKSFFSSVRRKYEKWLPMTGIFSMMTSFAISLSRFLFSEWIQWNCSAFFLSNAQTAWAHLFCMITDSSSKRKMHIARFLSKWSGKCHLKRKNFPYLVPYNFACYFYPLLILKGWKVICYLPQ